MQKSWAHLKAENSWTMFKMMAEFVEGFEKLNRIGPCISIFGSARTKSGTKYYELAREMAKVCVQEGYGVITGGGPGVMEAGNKGAHEEGGVSVGLNIDLPFEQNNNPWIDRDKNIDFGYFFIRKVMFVKYAQAFICLPGGFGTMDELFETLTLIQTKKITAAPVILIGSEFWSGLKQWITTTMLEGHSNISVKDLELIPIVDTPHEAMDIVKKYYDLEGELEPNLTL